MPTIIENILKTAILTHMKVVGKVNANVFSALIPAIRYIAPKLQNAETKEMLGDMADAYEDYLDFQEYLVADMEFFMTPHGVFKGMTMAYELFMRRVIERLNQREKLEHQGLHYTMAKYQGGTFYTIDQN